MGKHVSAKDFIHAQSGLFNARAAISTLPFGKLSYLCLQSAIVTAKSTYKYYRDGPRHPAWDICVQLAVDASSRMHGLVFPYYPDDSNIETIDLHKIIIPLRNCCPNISTWPRTRGICRGYFLNTQDVSIDTRLFSTVDMFGTKLTGLVEDDMACLRPRMLNYEIILGTSAINELEHRVSDTLRLLDIAPVFGDEKIVLYFHGGGWMSGSIGTHRQLTGKISQASRTRVVSAEYRLSPEHAFPAHLHDTLIAYIYLINQGFKPSNIVVAGDSAGGHLALTLTHLLRSMKLSPPGGLVLLSPASNIRYYTGTHNLAKYYDYLIAHPLESPTSLTRIMYAPGQPLTEQMMKELESPLVSPVFGSFVGFPPTLIQTGGCEVLLDDNIVLSEKIKHHNPDRPDIVRHDIYDGMTHVFQTILAYRPETAISLEKIGSFIRRL